MMLFAAIAAASSRGRFWLLYFLTLAAAAVYLT